MNIPYVLEGNEIHLQKKGAISCVKGTLHAGYFLEFGNDSQGALNIIHACKCICFCVCVCACVCYVLGGKEGGTCLLCRPGPTGGKKRKGKLGACSVVPTLFFWDGWGLPAVDS